MPPYARVRTRALRRLLVRKGFLVPKGFIEVARNHHWEVARNHHWRYRHNGLDWYIRESFGDKEMGAIVMGAIIVGTVMSQLRMTVDEFRPAMNGDIPERFTNPCFWSN